MNETTICIIALVMLLALFATGIEMSFAMALGTRFSLSSC